MRPELPNGKAHSVAHIIGGGENDHAWRPAGTQGTPASFFVRVQHGRRGAGDAAGAAARGTRWIPLLMLHIKVLMLVSVCVVCFFRVLHYCFFQVL